MNEVETIGAAPEEYAPVPTQSGLIVSTDALSGRFINPPPGKLYLLYGRQEIFHLSLFVASNILARHRPIAVVDGANRFDAYYLARILREQYGDPEPFLNNIYVSRGFTCYQMEAAITQRLPQFLNRMKSKTAMIFGLLDTFYDEQAKFHEVRRNLQRILRKLHEMKKEGVSVLLASLETKVLPDERNQLFRMLKSSVDQIYRLEVDDGCCQLFLESPKNTLHRMLSSAHVNCHSDESRRSRGVRNDIRNEKESNHGSHRSDIHIPHSGRNSLVDKIPTRTAERGPGNLR